MIHFITESSIHEVIPTDDLKIGNSLKPMKDYLDKLEDIDHDTETTGLDPYKSDILLGIFGDDVEQFVVDFTCERLRKECSQYLNTIADKKTFVGSNMKFDYKMDKVNLGVTLKKTYDVEIVERRLLQGFEAKNTDIRHNLVAITQRRCGTVPAEMNKETRLEFVGADPKTFRFNNRHIAYSAYDIKPLKKIKEVQKFLITKSKMEFLIEIEQKLLRRLGDAELEGYHLNLVKWRENIAKQKKIRFEKQCQLDVELRRLRDTLLPPEERQYLTGGKFDRDRTKRESLELTTEKPQLSLFDVPIDSNVTAKKKAKNTEKSPYTNYSSPDQLVEIFGRLKQPLPTKTGKLEIPKFETSTNNKKGDVKIKVDKSVNRFTTGEGAIESYLIEFPDTPIKDFVKLLIEYRTASTRINTFGEGFIKQFLNPKTGKFHTIFRQCDAVSGRLQSGDKDNGWFNSQNIPAEKEYRECFHTDLGYSISTTDLSGAEVIIMASKSGDLKLYQMAVIEDDTHSPIAQAAWRAIFRYRYTAALFKGAYAQAPEMIELNDKANNYVITKKINKDVRTVFKNVTFAVIYGARHKKVAKMLNVSLEEAKIVITVVKNFLSKPDKMVETNVAFALTNGWLTINPRTNSRIWYPPVCEAKKANGNTYHYKKHLPSDVEHDVDGNARNTPIQGTQADMVKEAIVEIGDVFEAQNIDACLLGQVHDEVIYKHAKCHDGISEEWKANPKPVYIEENGQRIALSAPEFIKRKMIEVANRYLIPEIKMGAEQVVLDTWTK